MRLSFSLAHKKMNREEFGRGYEIKQLPNVSAIENAERFLSEFKYNEKDI